MADDSSPVYPQPFYRPVVPTTSPLQGQIDAVNRLQTAVTTGVTEHNKLQDQEKRESALHDDHHAKMLAAEKAVVARIEAVNKRRANVKIDFKAGREKGLLAKPRLSVRGLPRDDPAVKSLWSEFEEYLQKWQSHRETDRRLEAVSKARQRQEKRSAKTERLLETAQQRLARATSAQARQAERTAKYATKRQRLENRNLVLKAKREGIESRQALIKARREQIESRRAARELRAMARQTRREEKERVQHERQIAAEAAEHAKIAKESKEMVEKYGMNPRVAAGVASRRTPFPEVYVRRHKRQLP